MQDKEVADAVAARPPPTPFRPPAEWDKQQQPPKAYRALKMALETQQYADFKFFSGPRGA
eukprot:1141032-Pelagomonas_calceolata.AAC.9